MKMRQVCGFDHHLESQAMALSTPIQVPGASVKLDFIGKIEHLVHDFMTMLQLAQAKTGLSVDRIMPRGEIVRFLNTTNTNARASSSKEHMGALRDSALDELAAGVFAHDMACLGYTDAINGTRGTGATMYTCGDQEYTGYHATLR